MTGSVVEGSIDDPAEEAASDQPSGGPGRKSPDPAGDAASNAADDTSGDDPANGGGSGQGDQAGATQTDPTQTDPTQTDPTQTDRARTDPAEKPDADVVDALFDAPPIAEQERMVEAILFASAEPMSRAQLEDRLPHGSDVPLALEHLRKRYEGRGVQVARIAAGYAFRTAPDLGFLMRRQATESRKLSRAAIETLAIVAYHQPVTRAEIEEIRGVSVSRGTVDMLLELDWIRLGRRRETPGRPVTFVVTQAFLAHFGLESARDLPGLKELRASGLLDSMPPVEGEDDTQPGNASETDDMFTEDGRQAEDKAAPDAVEQPGNGGDATGAEHGDAGKISR